MTQQTAFYNQLTAKGLAPALATPISQALANQCNGQSLTDTERALIQTAHRIIFNY